MKKIAVLAMLVSLISIAAVTSDANAAAIGGKVIYNKMMDDYADANLENNLSGGIFFDVGPFLFKSLRFRPGLDWVKLETEDVEIATVFGIHLDWYWFFLKGSRRLAPFIGFGPAINYYNSDDDRYDGDSDAGIEGFVGLEFNITGPLSLIAEVRLVQHDIADLDARILKGCAGLLYYF